MWDLIVSVPDHCLSSYFFMKGLLLKLKQFLSKKIHWFSFK